MLADTRHRVRQRDCGQFCNHGESFLADVRHAFLHHDAGYIGFVEIFGIGRSGFIPWRNIKLRVVRHASRTRDTQLIDVVRTALDVPFAVRAVGAAVAAREHNSGCLNGHT